jgi:hypothetical protein
MDQFNRPRSGIASYSDAANWFFNSFWNYRTRSELRMLKMRSIKACVSDYALYWFDYKAGYDVVLAQLGWNYSRQLNVALCRGAATVHDRDWGVIITWTYTKPPYLESGEELFDDLVLAYENGAKYILVFDGDENYTQSILGEEHLDAMKKFWQYTRDHPRPTDLLNGRVAFVLPKDYGYGFRGPNDKVWGFFEADNLTGQICVDVNELLLQFGTRLDIVYDDELLFNSPAIERYSEIFMWNETK